MPAGTTILPQPVAVYAGCKTHSRSSVTLDATGTFYGDRCARCLTPVPIERLCAGHYCPPCAFLVSLTQRVVEALL